MVMEINGLELNYEISGDGEPLLWLHGFMGAGPDWKYIFKDPPAGFRLIAPDLRGHGASTPQDAMSMRGIFVAGGPAFKRGVSVPPFENVSVYNLLTSVLGVSPAPNDGDPSVVSSP